MKFTSVLKRQRDLFGKLVSKYYNGSYYNGSDEQFKLLAQHRQLMVKKSVKIEKMPEMVSPNVRDMKENNFEIGYNYYEGRE